MGTQVAIMEFDKEKRQFHFLKEMTLPSIPTSGDKVAFDIEGTGYIFRVYDVHYSDDRRVDVNVIRISTIADYYNVGYPDIS